MYFRLQNHPRILRQMKLQKQMKQETQAVVGKITQLRESSQDILNSGSNTSIQLSQMSNFAQAASNQSQENVRLVGEVHHLISSFKVD